MENFIIKYFCFYSLCNVMVGLKRRQLVKGVVVEKTVWTIAVGIPISTNLVVQFIMHWINKY